MKTLYLIIANLLLINCILAQEFEVNGINYNVTSGNPSEVEVIAKSGGYSGNIEIPTQVTYNTITFSVTRIGSDAFYVCSNVTSVVMPNTITSIGRSTFASCTGLTSIILPNSLTHIDESAFSKCSGLSSLTIPSSVTNIGWMAFSLCTGLNSINVDSANQYYVSLDDVLYTTDMDTLLQFPLNKNITIFNIPNTVTIVGHRSFNGASRLEFVSIPNSVTMLGHRAFNECTGLTTIACCALTPPTLYSSNNSNAFQDLWTLLITLYIPNESVAIYAATDVWQDFILTGVDNCNTIDVESINKEQTYIYPNPVVNVINIEIPQGSLGNFELYDLHGRKLFSKSIDGNISISTDWLKKGMYIYYLTINELRTVGKIIKE
jgi:hypothetical protein